jgi:hypothetical protein
METSSNLFIYLFIYLFTSIPLLSVKRVELFVLHFVTQRGLVAQCQLWEYSLWKDTNVGLGIYVFMFTGHIPLERN